MKYLIALLFLLPVVCLAQGDGSKSHAEIGASFGGGIRTGTGVPEKPQYSGMLMGDVVYHHKQQGISFTGGFRFMADKSTESLLGFVLQGGALYALPLKRQLSFRTSLTAGPSVQFEGYTEYVGVRSNLMSELTTGMYMWNAVFVGAKYCRSYFPYDGPYPFNVHRLLLAMQVRIE
ncbi:MAG: hypothetical protein J0L80_06850 [Chitinophagales bacterium]|nr:hypothetical protein [Chitinophagales bacterium]